MKIIRGFLMIVGLLTCFIGVDPVQEFLRGGRELLITFVMKIFEVTLSCFLVFLSINFIFSFHGFIGV